MGDFWHANVVVSVKSPFASSFWIGNSPGRVYRALKSGFLSESFLDFGHKFSTYSPRLQIGRAHV